ncbi:MAG: hypothetical protein NTW21_25860 [Verrucomicrobia bacterium]|nr:hypothetical protein [Verrucomicrobiota bacterium]
MMKPNNKSQWVGNRGSILRLGCGMALMVSVLGSVRAARGADTAGQVRFDFESGDLQGWQVVEGRFVRVVTDRPEYHNKGAYASRQGRFHLSTVEGVNDSSADPQRGVLESPVFRLDGPELSFLIGGGSHADTYVALCTLDGKEQAQARGKLSEVMTREQWNLPQLVGQNVFLRVFDGNDGGWGHVTLDDVVATGRLDPAATAAHFAKRKRVLSARSGDSSPSLDMVRLAVEDLSATFGDRYPGGTAFLQELDELQKSSDSETADQAEMAVKLADLQQRALLANPLVSGREIVFVARPQYAAIYHAIDTLFQVGEATEGKFAPGGALKVLNAATGETRTLIETPQGTVRSPCVHFDGGKILFAMRRTAKENLHIFEINADGTGLKQLTCAPGVSDFDPLYLPDGGIVFSSTREPKFNMCSQDIGANLFRMEADGANILQITKSTLFENQAGLMPDGRIVYKRWEYVDRNFGDAHGFWTVYPDGTQQAVLWGNNKADPAAVYYPRVMAQTGQLLCILSTHHQNMWGALAIIDPSIDTDRNAAILRTWPANVRASLRDTDNFDCDRLGGVNPKYEDPWPLSSKYFLCSRSDPQQRMGIYLLDVFGNELLVHGEAPGCFSAMPLAATPRPPVTPERRDFNNSTGLLYVTDVYQGTHMQGVKRGSVKKLRIVESPEKRAWTDGKWFGQGFQAPGMNWHDFTAKRILGSVPVEADGSAYFAVPADTFIFFQLLDADDMMIQSMRSGTVVQSGERTGCVGCHDSRMAAPPPSLAVPLALRREPSTIEPWYGPARSFSFMAEVQPVLNKHCVECHDFDKPAGRKLILAGDRDPFFNAAYTELWRKKTIQVVGAGPAGILQPYSWGSHPSLLVKVLREGHATGGQGPDLDHLKLDQESFDRIVTWIDINAPYYPTYDSAYPDNPAGRSPLPGSQLARLSALTGENCAQDNFASSTGPWLSFDRPDHSPALAKLDKNSPQYKEALAIIQTGKDALSQRPRGDTLEFTPCDKDRQREDFYRQRQQVESSNREAIRVGKKFREAFREAAK